MINHEYNVVDSFFIIRPDLSDFIIIFDETYDFRNNKYRLYDYPVQTTLAPSPLCFWSE